MSLGSIDKNDIHFYILCYMRSQRSSVPAGFSSLMNHFGPDFVLIHLALPFFPIGIISLEEFVASPFRCICDKFYKIGLS